jgi:hypothetical protein
MHSSPTRPDPGQIPGLALSVMLLVASVLVLVMSVSSAFNTQPEKWFSHPDEYLHRAAARYYVDHWLPPKVGHPATLDSYSREYGLSYLNEPDIVYFLTGKFAVLLSPVLEADPAFRLFNVLLFFALAVYCSRRREAALIFLPLVLSPQLWYMFSYFNGDAFPLFISILLAFQLAVPSSAFGKSLDGGEARKTLWGVVLLGALIGVLFLSKRNYYFFLAAVPVVIAFRLFGVAPGVVISLATLLAIATYLGFVAMSQTMVLAIAVGVGGILLVLVFANSDFRRRRAVVLGKLGAVAGVAVLVAAPRLIFDVVQHGSLHDRDVAMGQLAEKLARAEYKPSRIHAGERDAFYGSGLKTKGLRLEEIFRSPWSWHIKTFQSATGNYGWLEFRGPRTYYLVMGLGYLALMCYVMWGIARSRDPTLQASHVAIGCFAVAMIALAAYFSWTSDFQAQGRYLFPIVSMFSLVLYSARRCISELVCVGMAGFCFVLSCYSFVFVGLADIPKSNLFKSVFW